VVARLRRAEQAGFDISQSASSAAGALGSMYVRKECVRAASQLLPLPLDPCSLSTFRFAASTAAPEAVRSHSTAAFYRLALPPSRMSVWYDKRRHLTCYMGKRRFVIWGRAFCYMGRGVLLYGKRRFLNHCCHTVVPSKDSRRRNYESLANSIVGIDQLALVTCPARPRRGEVLVKFMLCP